MKGLTLSPYLAVIGVFTLLSNGVQVDVQLSHLSTVYLPAAKEQKPAFGAGAVEQIAYDPVRKLIYAAGNHVYHVISAADPANLTVEHTSYEDAMDFTDVEICGGHVFMTVNNENDQLNGVLRVYKAFDTARSDPMELVIESQVGSLPDMLNVVDNCRTVIIAVEGEAFIHNGTLVDPEGRVSIVHFPDGPDMAASKTSVTSLGFDAFNDRYEELKPSGVRFVYTDNNNKLSNDLEPEYIVVDEDANKAYVVLQENNALAEVDLTTHNITNIRGLGYKQWGTLDASDRDGGIQITYWPIRAWYLPDSAKFHQWQNRKLLFTANEGDSKEYSTPAFDESIRGKDISASDLGPEIHQMVRSAISDDTQLGRLTFSRLDGKDEEAGNYSALYTYGARSFSIWDMTPPGDEGGSATAALPLIFDSGSQFEEITALHCPHLFNRQEDGIDGRSDNKGPEPESITLGEMNNRLYIFVGLERPGTIVVYSLGRDVSRPRFETIHCAGIPDSSKTMLEMFEDQEIYGVDPEDLRFYPAAESPTGRPVLMVAGTVSGTVTLLEVKVTNDHSADEPQNPDTTNRDVKTPTCPDSAVIRASSLMLTSLCLLLRLW